MSDDKNPLPLGTPLPFYGVDNHCFKVGDKVYEAVEDPDDGYRSYLGSVEVRHDSQIFFRTPLDTVTVEEVRRGNLFEGYEIKSVQDGHIWLEFGTENFGKYYPGFVFNYTPRLPAPRTGASEADLKDARQLNTVANSAFPNNNKTLCTQSRRDDEVSDAQAECASCPQRMMYGGLFCCKAVSEPLPPEWVQFIKRKQEQLEEAVKAEMQNLKARLQALEVRTVTQVSDSKPERRPCSQCKGKGLVGSSDLAFASPCMWCNGFGEATP